MTDKLLKLEEFTRYNNALKGKIRWFGTRTEYDAIVTKDPNTLYLITDEGKIYRNGVLYGGQPMDADWSTTSISGLQNLKITSGITHCYGDGDSGLPGAMKRIRSGDTLPSGGTEGDIFFKHRGTNADYLISTDIINDLTTGGTDKVLSAEQGKLLQTNKVNFSDVINAINSTETTKPLSANMGKWLADNKVGWDYTSRGETEAFNCDNGGNFEGGWWVLWGHFLLVDFATGGNAFNVGSTDALVRIGWILGLPRPVSGGLATGHIYSVATSKFEAVQWRIESNGLMQFYRNTELGTCRYGRFQGMFWVP